MTNWKRAKNEWDAFLTDVAKAKEVIGCQSRSAWFRGLKDNRFDLSPSIFRASSSIGQILSNLDGGRILAQIKRKPDQCRSLVEIFTLSGALSVQYAKYIDASLRTALTSNGSDREKAFLNFLGSVPGERDGFHEFFNRSGLEAESSWTALAHMRHHGVPTRLLDWSDSFLVSMYFGLEDYMNELVPFWREVGAWKGEFPPFAFPDRANSPGLWVLNPFHLAEEEGIVGMIPYPDLPPVPDFYETLLEERNWPYKRPIPLHAPRNDPRMVSQRGYFTVHGVDVRPIEAQIGANQKILSNVPMTRSAAVYGAYFLWRYANLDKFELFRDLDTLGDVISARHFGATQSNAWVYFEDVGKFRWTDFLTVPGRRGRHLKPGDIVDVKTRFHLRQGPFSGLDVSAWRKKPKISLLSTGERCKVIQVFSEGQTTCVQLARHR